MNRTAELRWFLRGPPPEPLVAWFERAADPPQTRTDVYLALPGTDALGVKIRGGATSFELKLRPRPGAPLDLPAQVSGQLEEWQKWSLSRSWITRSLPRLGLPKGRWVAVEKQRRMTKIPSGGDSGCNVELTALAASGQTWSTLGFESFGPEPDLVPTLEAAAEALFGSLDLPGGLDTALSCGYPGWLATL
jgi:hypothetical protein